MSYSAGSVLAVRTFPHPHLKSPSQSIGAITPLVRRLVADLIETMRAHPRCVGLAAPQVGVNLRVAVIDVTGHPKVARSHGLMVCLNPRIAAQEGQSVQREGCLSVPDLTGNVGRATRVLVEALDETGKPWRRWLDGFEAIAAQHEIDHLDGKLFLDRVVSLKTDLFQRKNYGARTH